MAFFQHYPLAVYTKRLEALKNQIEKTYAQSKGIIMLCANFESPRHFFRQESTFLYFTGLTDPGIVWTHEIHTGKTIAWIPDFGGNRAQWMAGMLNEDASLSDMGIDEIRFLGKQQSGYVQSLICKIDAYEHILAFLQEAVVAKIPLYTCATNAQVEQRLLLDQLMRLQPSLTEACIDIAPLIARLRRIKQAEEMEDMREAIAVTMLAQVKAASFIEAGAGEYEIVAAIESLFTQAGCSTAFPSIVASGSNATILHYNQAINDIDEGDLVVVDIGASFNGYCADLTRTYPANKRFSKEQRSLYNIVYDTQQYIADMAQPGYWISNKENPDKSLHHLALEFLRKKGYDRYLVHGIGHFLGLDVHDVGDVREPLQPGDIITIEPGIYIASEGIGIRIEDNYRITDDGVEHLSAELPRTAEQIEELMEGAHNFEQECEDEQECDDECCDD